MQQIAYASRYNEDDDLESVFSLDDEQGSHTLFMVPAFEASDSESSISSSDDKQYLDYLTIQNLHSIQPFRVPLAPLKIFIDGLPNPIKVTAFFDTGAAQTIANPLILSSSMWKEQKTFFKTADESIFSTDFISKSVTIQFFLGCTVHQQILGSPLPQKDLVVGFDLITSKPGLKLSGKGIKYKQYFQPWQSLPNLFTISSQIITFGEIKLKIILTSSANSHSEFILKCPNPLWKNPDFYISLPFKKDETVNSIKASHSGMNPDHLKLAIEECSQLLS